MRAVWSGRFRMVFVFLVVLGVVLSACGAKTQATHAFFVGKWKSSKLSMPVVLLDNGEWEIRSENGDVLQYGLWEYRGDSIVWRFKRGSETLTEVNPVIYAKDREFRLEEGGQTTVFLRIE